ncbi:hypothetical protein [Rhizobium sp. BK251]|uniref:PepSY domain-containing protein n=1 Tax=Rhizobium sp. BK251 TaxID=2512125 RepID=UPI00104869BB|nr:hypothetical protein [Rhizobium sp. BK251]
MGPTRRRFLALLFSAACLAVTGSLASPAAAKDGGSNSGSGSSGSGSGSGSGGGSSGSGSNSGSSGHGGGDDDHSGHGGGGDDAGNDDHGGTSGSGSGSGRADYDRARDAVRDGRILPLKSVLQKIDTRRYGRVIDVDLNRSLLRDVYQLKLRDSSGTIRTLRVDARSGALLGGD